MHDSAVIADYLLELADNVGKTLTPMQVLKLVYIAHGWSLGLYGNPLIKDEIQAWQYGPVIPALYNKIRKFRSNPVKRPVSTRTEGSLNDIDTHIIKEVFRVYGNRTGPALSRITHADGTPWHKTYEPGSFGTPISNDLIQDHYNLLAEKAA